MGKHEKWIIGAITVLGMSIIMTTIVNIMLLAGYNFKADSAFYITLAQEQLRTGNLFPKGIHYSTALFVLTPNLLMVPLLKVIPNLLMVRQLAIVILWACILWLIYIVFVRSGEKYYRAFGVASSLFLILYVNSEVVDMHFYQGAYITYLLFELLFLAVLVRTVTKRTYQIHYYVLLIVISVLANLGEIRSILIFGLPGIIAVAAFSLAESHFDILSLQDKRQEFVLIGVLFLGVVLGFAAFRSLTSLYGGANTTNSMQMISCKKIMDSISAFIVDMFAMFGGAQEVSLISIPGIIRCIHTVVFVLVSIVAPLIVWKKYYSIEGESLRFIVLFCLCSNIIYSFIAIMVGGAITTDRYLIPVYNNNIILFAIMFSMVTEKYSFNFRNIALCTILLYVLMSNLYYFKNQKSVIDSEGFGCFSQRTKGVIEALEDAGLHFGYATFYNAEEYSVLSNNRVLIHNVKLAGSKLSAATWLTSDYFYEPERHKGRTFLMLTKDETAGFAPDGIENTIFGKPEEVIEYDRFNIIIYSYNISEKF